MENQYPITPLDGRYAAKVVELSPIVSEFGLMKCRARVMIEWVCCLAGHSDIPFNETVSNQCAVDFSDADFKAIKALEEKTNHDVKAVEYWLRTKLPKSAWPWIHFGCTSEDVNNMAYALMLKEVGSVIDDFLEQVITTLNDMAINWADQPMLSRTHGQPATPTTVGHEFAVFAHRLERVAKNLGKVTVMGKWSGATGNFAAHTIALPDVDWLSMSGDFVESFDVEWNPMTTQIESHDYMISLLNGLGHLSGIMDDLCSDLWGYVSIEYFGQKVVATETGSSTMPGKVNPIDLENARTNFRMARGVGQTMAQYLPVSTWQRDLSDSTLQRNFGPVFGYFLLGLKGLQKGLNKLVLRLDRIEADLVANPSVLGEAIQTLMRRHGDVDAYEKLKDFQRGKELTLRDFREFITRLGIPDEDVDRLIALEPRDYVGLSAALVQHYIPYKA